MIEFNCPCGEPLAAEPEHAGAEVQCPKCGKMLSIPGGGPKRGRPVDDEPLRKRRTKRRNYDDADTDAKWQTKRLMDRANAELDEDEATRRGHAKIAITPGIIAGLSVFVICGLLGVLALLMLQLYLAVGLFVFAALGLARAVLSFLGQGWD